MKHNLTTILLLILISVGIALIQQDITYHIKQANKKIDTVYTIRKIDKQRDTDTVIIKHTNYK